MRKLAVTFDPTVYQLTVIKKAAYKFGDRYHIDISTQPDGSIQVLLDPKAGRAVTHDILGDFRNEVLDQDLRETIALETERTRNLLLAEAFSSVSRMNTVTDNADFRDDPLKIAAR